MAAPRPIDVVFVHGLLSSPRVWRSFIKIMADDPELADFVTVQCFRYDSPLIRFRPDRRIAELDDIADALGTYLAKLPSGKPVVLVTHSQGGLVVQRYLARMLASGRGRELAQVKRVVMFSCPNSGSEFLISLRQGAVFWRNPQERELRPLADRQVTETQRIVLESVVYARECTQTSCPIPIVAYGALNDNIVPPVVAASVFPVSHVIEGDHFSVVRPQDSRSAPYLALRAELMAAASEPGRSGTEPATAEPSAAAQTSGAQPAAAQSSAGQSSAAQPAAAQPAAAEPAGSSAAGPKLAGTLPADGDDACLERPAQVSVAPPFGRLDARLHGRDKLMASIMSSGQRSRVHILAGLGGSGKSRLALEIAHRAQREGRQVWWVDAVRLNSCMREVANQLGAPAAQVELTWRGDGSATDLVWRLLNAGPRPWLLVFDNVDDPQRLALSGTQVSDGTGWLRQPGSAGMVIVTSRNRDQATWGAWAIVHHVLPLDDDDGASMLKDLAPAAEGTFDDARSLSRALGGLPLALRVAADYLNSVIADKIWSGAARIKSFEAYRAAVQERFASPLAAHGYLSEPLGIELMRGVTDLSLNLLSNRGLKNAGPLLRLLACLNFAPVPYHVLLDDGALAQSTLLLNFAAERHAVLDGLSSLGLIELLVLDGVTDPGLSHVLSLHPVVHGLIRGDSDIAQRWADYYGLSTRMLLAATRNQDPDLPQNWATWYLIAPHAVEVTKAILLGDTRPSDRRVTALALELAKPTARYLIAAGLLAPARDLVLGIVDRCPSFGFRPDDREILALRHEKGRIALERGDPKAAEAEFRKVIVARERVLGAADPDTLASRHKLAKAVLEQGRFDEAEPLLRSIVEAEQTVRGPEHSDTMVVQHSLARAELALRRFPEAERMIREILQIRDRLWPPETPETLFARHTLARCLLEQGKVAEAEDEVRDALRHAAGHPDVPIAMSLRHMLITVLLMQGRTSEAATELTSLLADRRRVLGDTHPETERTRQDLARTQAALTDQRARPVFPRSHPGQVMPEEGTAEFTPAPRPAAEVAPEAAADQAENGRKP